MKKQTDFTVLAIIAAAVAIYFATRPKPSTTPPVSVLHGPGARRPLHDVA